VNTWSKSLTPAPNCHRGVHDRAERVFTIGRMRSQTFTSSRTASVTVEIGQQSVDHVIW
jgi:hypothetical protein